MEMEKKSNSSKYLIILLIIIILGLIGYIVYDKVINKKEDTKQTEEKSKQDSSKEKEINNWTDYFVNNPDVNIAEISVYRSYDPKEEDPIEGDLDYDETILTKDEYPKFFNSLKNSSLYKFYHGEIGFSAYNADILTILYARDNQIYELQIKNSFLFSDNLTNEVTEEYDEESMDEEYDYLNADKELIDLLNKEKYTETRDDGFSGNNYSFRLYYDDKFIDSYIKEQE